MGAWLGGFEEGEGGFVDMDALGKWRGRREGWFRCVNWCVERILGGLVA